MTWCGHLRHWRPLVFSMSTTRNNEIMKLQPNILWLHNIIMEFCSPGIRYSTWLHLSNIKHNKNIINVIVSFRLIIMSVIIMDSFYLIFSVMGHWTTFVNTSAHVFVIEIMFYFCLNCAVYLMGILYFALIETKWIFVWTLFFLSNEE